MSTRRAVFLGDCLNHQSAVIFDNGIFVHQGAGFFGTCRDDGSPDARSLIDRTIPADVYLVVQTIVTAAVGWPVDGVAYDKYSSMHSAEARAPIWRRRT